MKWTKYKINQAPPALRKKSVRYPPSRNGPSNDQSGASLPNGNNFYLDATETVGSVHEGHAAGFAVSRLTSVLVCKTRRSEITLDDLALGHCVERSFEIDYTHFQGFMSVKIEQSTPPL